MLYALLLLAVLVFWAIGAYNRLVRLKNRIATAFRLVDAPLQRRHELTVAMVSQARLGRAVRHDMLDALLAAGHQAATALNALRAQPASALAAQSCSVAQQVLGSRLDQLHQACHPAQTSELPEAQAVVHASGASQPGSGEHEPASGGLAVDPAMQVLVVELAAIEQKSLFVREGYNLEVQAYNAAVHQFPASLLAMLFGLGEAAALDFEMSAWRQASSPILASQPAALNA
jgi:LemA protein